jgi:hypothetical protein
VGEEKKKLAGRGACMSLGKLLTVDNQSSEKIYEIIKDFYILLKNDNWINKLSVGELEVLRLVGYELSLKNIVNEELFNNKKLYCGAKNTEKK